MFNATTKGTAMKAALLAYRKSCMFLYGMTDAGFDRALGLRIANAKVRALIAMLRAS